MVPCVQDKMIQRDKIIQLVWDLTMAAEAPPELLDSRTIESVVSRYINPSEVLSCSLQGRA